MRYQNPQFAQAMQGLGSALFGSGPMPVAPPPAQSPPGRAPAAGFGFGHPQHAPNPESSFQLPDADEGSGSQLTFLNSLIGTESGGNWSAQNNEQGSGGAGHFGRVQFGRGRLQDAERAGVIPQGFSPESLVSGTPEAQQTQRALERWHFNDLNQNIDRMGLGQYEGQTMNGVPVTRSGMMAAAHLGGMGGLRQFLQTGGQHNPADAYGTSLADYMRQHGGLPTGSSFR